jgi:hypothetical protein
VRALPHSHPAYTKGLNRAAMGSDRELTLLTRLTHFDFTTRTGVLREDARGKTGTTDSRMLVRSARNEYCCDWFYT